MSSHTGQSAQAQHKQTHQIYSLAKHAHPLILMDKNTKGPSSTLLRRVLYAEDFHYTQMGVLMESAHRWF